MMEIERIEEWREFGEEERDPSPHPGGLNAEPILIRPIGQSTVFGLNSRFSTQFPHPLLARVAPEEFTATVKRVNDILAKSLPSHWKWLLFGFVCCSCTLATSFCPVIHLSRRTRLSICKLLELENARLYRRLGLEWNLVKTHLDSSPMLHHLIRIDFLPKKSLYKPD